MPKTIRLAAGSTRLARRSIPVGGPGPSGTGSPVGEFSQEMCRRRFQLFQAVASQRQGKAGRCQALQQLMGGLFVSRNSRTALGLPLAALGPFGGWH